MGKSVSALPERTPKGSHLPSCRVAPVDMVKRHSLGKLALFEALNGPDILAMVAVSPSTAPSQQVVESSLITSPLPCAWVSWCYWVLPRAATDPVILLEALQET